MNGRKSVQSSCTLNWANQQFKSKETVSRRAGLSVFSSVAALTKNNVIFFGSSEQPGRSGKCHWGALWLPRARYLPGFLAGHQAESTRQIQVGEGRIYNGTCGCCGFVSCYFYVLSLQILWEQAKSAVTARAWRLWEGPVGVHWGLRTHPNARDSWVSWQTRALMQFNRAAWAFCRLSFDKPTTFASFFLDLFNKIFKVNYI